MASARYRQLQKLQQSRKVRAKLDQVADRLAARVEQLGAAEGANVTVTVERSRGTRPKGRSYARVAVPAHQEHGTESQPRLRLLGRAVQSL